MSKKEPRVEKDELQGPEETGQESAATAQGAEPSGNVASGSTQLEQEEPDMTSKYEELNDKYLRLYSDFDNYRRRNLKEISDIRKNASEDLVIKLLPVLDDFERAIKAFGTTDNAVALKDGIILIFNKFLTLLSNQGLEQMKSMGEEFNTDYHEAITNIPAASDELKNKVVDEIEKGYLLNGKVIRYAKVVVGS